ncbi:DUF4007 family protein [Bacteriovorax sp. Seq25_V]|uniref:DUF4007 family protein n=1 Tax=Bacteriovorax sp. Seq25_V TaxID=1201288 RepID=UPI000389FA11|nr:DUF4007 family protein [Bacteriovorax sp. Seq25_V]EQC47585.1 PF13182 family protein [Bacteriovorax sp. Seq25_V]
MRFGAHQTFHLRDSWLLKGYDAVVADEKIFKSNNSVETLGVGKNMVEAIEYWMTALSLLIKDDSKYYLTEIAQEIFTNDQFLELDGSLLTLHYLLACNVENATSFHWFFNKFAATEFDTESLQVYLETYVQSLEKKINPNTLKKDISCILRMYKEPIYKDKVNPETENPSPFVKFNLVTEENKKLKKNKLRKSDIHPLIFVYLTYLFWNDVLMQAESFNLSELVNKELSPGLIMGFSEDDVVQIIEEIERLYGDKYMTYSRTGGYFILNLKSKTAAKSLENYYQEFTTRLGY